MGCGDAVSYTPLDVYKRQTLTRKKRERGKADSRSIEIQRLIGRSLRSILDFTALDGLTITVDCDVIQADGGTRTASITGGFVALSLCVHRLLQEGKIAKNPIQQTLAAVSAGIVEDKPLLDLCYQEDSSAQADMNFVGTEDGGISEIQICGEKRPISDEEFAALLGLCKQGVRQPVSYTHLLAFLVILLPALRIFLHILQYSH